MIEGISLTLAAIAFAAFLWTHRKLQLVQRHNRVLHRRVKAAHSKLSDFARQLEVVKTFNDRLTELHRKTEEHASKINHIQIGRR